MAGLLDQWFGAPADSGNSMQGLLGNPAFNMGLNMLAARYDRRINPAIAALRGLSTSQEYAQNLSDQAEKDRQQKALQALQSTMGGLLNPTDPTTQMFRPQAMNQTVDPTTGQPMAAGAPGGLLVPPTPQPGPGSLFDPQTRKLLAASSAVDPMKTLAAYTSMYGDATRPTAVGRQLKGVNGSTVMLENGHPGIVRIDPQNPSAAPRMWDMATNDWAAQGIGLAVQPSVSFQPGTNIPYVSSRTEAPTPLQTGDQVQNIKNDQALGELRFVARTNLPAVETEAAKLKTLTQYLIGDKDAALAHGLATWFPTIPGSDTSNWQSVQQSLRGMNFVDKVMALKQASTNGSTGFGALNQTEGENIYAASNDMVAATTQKQFKEAAQRFIKYTDLATANARKRAGLSETDDQYAPWNYTPQAWGGGIPGAATPGAPPNAGGPLAPPTAAPVAPGEYDYVPGKGLVPRQ